MTASLQARKWIRLAAYCFVVLAASPIRYWPLIDNLDGTWVFVLNYAAGHGLKVGSDVFFTYGPLAYLTFPQAFGSNLAQGLIFQACLWLLLARELECLFFRSNLPLRNLALFGFFIALSTPFYCFNFGGVENLILLITLVELYLYRLRGSFRHYMFALVFIGITPLIKLSACLMAAAGLAGFLTDRVIQDGWKAKREIALALLVPAAIAGGLTSAVLSGWQAAFRYQRVVADMIGGYTAAMSDPGPFWELMEAAVVLAVFLFFLLHRAKDNPGWARFSICTFAVPVLLSFKHGFVRQDIHVTNYFGFMALAMALISLKIPLERRRALPVGMAVVTFTFSWALVNVSELGADIFSTASGLHNAQWAWGALRPARLRRSLAPSTGRIRQTSLIEPEIQAIVAGAPAASLSDSYSVLGASGWNLRFYPVIQMYSAYTPYLDGLNAAWIRDNGPPFLIYDGLAIDRRDPWAATPATWLEVYRWYETSWLGPRHLLLRRRVAPRFTALDPVARFTVTAPLSLSLPLSNAPVFWSLRCANSLTGKIRKLLFRMAQTEMRIGSEAGAVRSARIIPEMLGTPVMGTYLPATLAQFAAVFQPNGAIPAVREFAFGGPGIDNYTPACEVELFRPRETLK